MIEHCLVSAPPPHKSGGKTSLKLLLLYQRGLNLGNGQRYPKSHRLTLEELTPNRAFLSVTITLIFVKKTKMELITKDEVKFVCRALV